MGEDRISRLADDVLCHILSFLPTKYAVGTSVLSKRWKHVWTSIPNLDFNDSLLLRQGMLSEEAAQTCFTNFVNNVLSLHNSVCLRNFHFDCAKDYDSSQAKAWISAAITRNIEDLDLVIPTMGVLIDLPQTLYYTCQNLVHLKLNYFNLVLNVSSPACLPCLKTLRLYAVEFADSDSMKNLLSGCPVLRDLYIEREEWDNALTLYVCSASLERLTIRNSMDHPVGAFVYDLVVETPNLQHLDLQDYTTENYEMKDLSSLVSADIDVMRSDIEISNAIQILKDVSNVKELRLSDITIDDLRDVSYDYLPMFHNLTYLKVGVSQKDRPIVPYLLDRSPNMKSLVFEKENLPGSGWGGWQTPDCVYGCLLTHLESIEIEEFQGGEDEMEMIRYFLKNSMVLKMMSIYSVDLDSEKMSEIPEKLMLLPKGSRDCQIEFH